MPHKLIQVLIFLNILSLHTSEGSKCYIKTDCISCVASNGCRWYGIPEKIQCLNYPPRLFHLRAYSIKQCMIYFPSRTEDSNELIKNLNDNVNQSLNETETLEKLDPIFPASFNKEDEQYKIYQPSPEFAFEYAKNSTDLEYNTTMETETLEESEIISPVSFDKEDEQYKIYQPSPEFAFEYAKNSTDLEYGTTIQPDTEMDIQFGKLGYGLIIIILCFVLMAIFLAFCISIYCIIKIKKRQSYSLGETLDIEPTYRSSKPEELAA